MPPESIVVEQGRNNSVRAQLEEIDKIELKYKEQQKSIDTLWGTFETPIRWSILTWHIIYHSIAVYALVNITQLKLWTFLWGILLGEASIFGVTAGVHRLWSHKAYKGTTPLRILVAACYSLSGQYSHLRWIRDHRLHHKYTDTNADPYSTGRGYFFTHMGWLALEKHVQLLRKGTGIDMTDIYQDSVLMFFHRNFLWAQIVIWGFFGVGVPVYFWGESFYWSFCAGVLRTVISGHTVAATNSFAHYAGKKPYDKNSSAGENIVFSFFMLGEGYHNFHHAFPWDARASEHKNYVTNLTNLFLDFFKLIGWAYDFKTASPELIRRFVLNNGDGSHPVYKRVGNEPVEPLDYNSHTY